MTTIESKEDEKVQFYLKILRKNLRDIMKQYKINYMGIFGSYVRKEQKKYSDLDILVEFFETPSLFHFIRLEHYLSELLGTKVDLVMKDALKHNIGKQILKEVIEV